MQINRWAILSIKSQHTESHPLAPGHLRCLSVALKGKRGFSQPRKPFRCLNWRGQERTLGLNVHAAKRSTTDPQPMRKCKNPKC